jgi:uncharacterized protein with GYD domain
MAKYLLRASYTAEGTRGLVKDGGTKRTAAARTLIESLGGKVDALYWAFGTDDIICICDMPDHASAAAASMAITGSGALRTGNLTVLLTADDMDNAAKKSPIYTPPGR